MLSAVSKRTILFLLSITLGVACTAPNEAQDDYDTAASNSAECPVSNLTNPNPCLSPSNILTGSVDANSASRDLSADASLADGQICMRTWNCGVALGNNSTFIGNSFTQGFFTTGPVGSSGPNLDWASEPTIDLGGGNQCVNYFPGKPQIVGQHNGRPVYRFQLTCATGNAAMLATALIAGGGAAAYLTVQVALVGGAYVLSFLPVGAQAALTYATFAAITTYQFMESFDAKLQTLYNGTVGGLSGVKYTGWKSQMNDALGFVAGFLLQKQRNPSYTSLQAGQIARSIANDPELKAAAPADKKIAGLIATSADIAARLGY